MDIDALWDTVYPLLSAYGLPVLVLLLLIVGVVFLFGYMSLLFEFLRRKESVFFSQPTIDMIEKILQMALSIGLLVYFVFMLQVLSPWVREHVWLHLIGFLPTIITIALIISIAIVLIRILSTFTDYLKGDLDIKPIKAIKGEYISIVSLLLRYLIYAFSAASIVFVLVVALGFRDILFSKAADFFAGNVQFILFIALVLFSTYFVNRFVTSFFKDLSGRSTKFSPQLVRSAGTGIRILIFILATLLVVFAVLNMANLGGISQTILLLGTTMVGLVVAMAGTGSIGNALSGAVIITFRPFKKGDRVLLLEEGLVCDIMETTLIFTRVKTLEGEVVEIPNNLVLASPIKNWTSSVPFGVSVKVTLGYDIHHDTVTRLMKEAARRTKSVIMFPPPEVYLLDLRDFAIEYELVVHTNREKDVRTIRSDLMRNMQDVFYENGVEILSPVYEVHRRGAVIEERIPAPITRVEKVRGLDDRDEE